METKLDSPFAQDPDWKRLLVAASKSTKVFAMTFLPSYFTRPFASLTDQIFKAIDDPEKQKVVIAAPRGWGKTTIDTLAFPARHICYNLKKFIVQVSNTADDALLKARNLKNALVSADPRSGDILPTVFGDLRGHQWGEKHFISRNTYVMPRGSGQQIRGLNYMGYRPDLIIVDDLEDAEAVMSEERREKLKQWFFADLMNSVDRSKKDWKIVIIGTILHEASLLAQLLKDDTWERITISLCNDDLKSNWPDYMTDEQVEELYRSYRNQGQADTFAREYQNKPISGLDAVFKTDYFRYYEPSSLLEIKDLFYCTIVDPAKSTKLHSAESSVVTVGIDLAAHRIYFHDCVSGRLHPDELLDTMFQQVEMHDSRILAVEVTSLNEFITQPIKNEMRKRNIHPKFVELTARDKKENRVAQLAPFYRQGYIYHNKNVSSKLELQLISFPRSDLWDVMDAFAYVIELMELDEKYFYAEELPDEDEFSSLISERRLDDWRTA